MLQPITVENQLLTSDGRRYSHTDCGLACSLSMALDAGLPKDETIASMELWYAAHGDSPVDGTGTEINAAWLRQEGLDAISFQGDMSVVDNFLSQGFRVTLAIFSDSYGTPYVGPGDFGHFIELCYPTTIPNVGSAYEVMQPIDGQLLYYMRYQLVPTSQNCGFVVRHDYRQTGTTTTVIGTSSGGVPFMEDDPLVKLCVGDIDKQKIFLVNDFPYGPKKHILSPGDENAYLGLGMKVETVNQYILDRMDQDNDITASVQNPAQP